MLGCGRAAGVCSWYGSDPSDRTASLIVCEILVMFLRPECILFYQFFTFHANTDSLRMNNEINDKIT